MPAPADWQLPAGVSRAVWDYTHDTAVAERYDADLAGSPLLAADRTLLTSILDSSKDVLDIGCGTGRIAIPLAERGIRVAGLDLSEPMLHVADCKPGGSKVNWICGNAVQLPFADRTFDAAICMFATLGMISGPSARQQAVSECHRILRSSGRLVVHVHNLWHHVGTSAGRKMLTRDLLKRMTCRSTAGDFPMPSADGVPGWTMHLFTWRELRKLLSNAGLEIERRICIGIDGQELSRWRRWRCYGFLVVAKRIL